MIGLYFVFVWGGIRFRVIFRVYNTAFLNIGRG